jgi:predicted DNA-binding transcriptional regulator AlpA
MFRQGVKQIHIESGDFAAEKSISVAQNARLPDMSNPIRLLTVADICRRLGVSRAWVIEHSNGRRRPVLPSIKLGKVRRYDPLDVAAFIDDCRRIGQSKASSAVRPLY